MLMRKILIASLVVTGIGFVAAPAGQAAPVNNTVFKQLTDMDGVTTSTPTQVGWPGRWRWRGAHWRWGSRRGGRCHIRWSSGWRWC
jgi:hypothetical protein